MTRLYVNRLEMEIHLSQRFKQLVHRSPQRRGARLPGRDGVAEVVMTVPTGYSISIRCRPDIERNVQVGLVRADLLDGGDAGEAGVSSDDQNFH